ncbi:hypothetical protein PV773_24695 [Mesorhizobium sp. CC13]
MKKYELSPSEFAMLAVAFDKIHAFFHNERNLEELISFRSEYYEIIKRINYQIISRKISDSQMDDISWENISPDESIDETIEKYIRIFTK